MVSEHINWAANHTELFLCIYNIHLYLKPENTKENKECLLFWKETNYKIENILWMEDVPFDLFLSIP